MPVGSAIQLGFHRLPLLQFGVLILPVYVVMFLAVVWREEVKPFVSSVNVVGLLVVCWGVFVVVLVRICFEWCLVGGRRGR